MLLDVLNKKNEQTSFVNPSSSLYPRFSKISCIAVESFLEQASPKGDRGDKEALWGIPISTWEATWKPEREISAIKFLWLSTWNSFFLKIKERHTSTSFCNGVNAATKDFGFGRSRGSYCKHREAKRTNSVPSSSENCPSKQESINVCRFRSLIKSRAW